MSELIEKKNCINCGEEFIGNFCHSCGQKKDVKRLTMKSVWIDFQKRILGLDNSFLRTFKTLWIAPGVVAKDNIEGNRVKYVGPVGYFFVVITLLVLLISLFGVNWNEFMSESTNPFGLEQSEKQSALQEQMMERIFDNFRVFQFFIIPFMAFSAKLFFRKSGYNYLEHMVLVFFVQGQMVFLTIINLFIFLIFDQTFLRLSMPISLLYYGWACLDFYPGKNKFARFIKGIFVQVLGLFFFMIAFMIVAFLFIIIYAKINPEFIEQFK